MGIRVYRIAAILGALVFAAQLQAAPDGAAIMKKATESMQKAKTYQAKWLVVVSMGDMGSMSLNMDMKTRSDGRTFMQTVPTGTPTGMMAMGAGMAASTTVDNGKDLIVYMKGMNSYFKAPRPKNADSAASKLLGAGGAKGATFKLVGSENVKGRACYVIAVTAPLPPQMAGSGMKVTTRAYVDKQTSRLRQVKSVTTMPAGMMGGPGGPGGPGGQGAKPMQMTNTMVLVSEKLNAPIADSVFKFTPPAGAKEMKGGPMGMGGPGRPGGPPAGPGGPPR